MIFIVCGCSVDNHCNMDQLYIASHITFTRMLPNTLDIHLPMNLIIYYIFFYVLLYLLKYINDICDGELCVDIRFSNLSAPSPPDKKDFLARNNK